MLNWDPLIWDLTVVLKSNSYGDVQGSFSSWTVVNAVLGVGHGHASFDCVQRVLVAQVQVDWQIQQQRKTHLGRIFPTTGKIIEFSIKTDTKVGQISWFSWRSCNLFLVQLIQGMKIDGQKSITGASSKRLRGKKKFFSVSYLKKVAVI